MFRAFPENTKFAPRRPVILVASLGLSLVGCSQMSGLRSVGAERPSLLALWERPKNPSPSPGADSYAQAMHGGDDETNALAAEDSEKTRDSSDPAPAAKRPSLARLGPKPKTPSVPPGRDRRPSDDEAVRVTLGQPTTLPSAKSATALALNQPAKTGSWRGERSTAPASESTELPLAANPSPRVVTHPVDDPRAILARVEKAVDQLDSYQVHMTRSERMGQGTQPDESILLSIRRNPRAVRLEWTSGPNKGREVIYSAALDPKSLFVHMPTNGLPLPTMKISVDNPLVRKNSRHSITEAGFDVMLKELLSAGSNSTSQIDYRGLEKPKGDDALAYHFVHHDDHGETWDVFLDPQSLLPRRVEARDSRGQVIEHYVYKEMKPNPAALTAADAFEPDQRWGRSEGMLSRFARGFSGTANEPTTTR